MIEALPLDRSRVPPAECHVCFRPAGVLHRLKSIMDDVELKSIPLSAGQSQQDPRANHQKIRTFRRLLGAIY
ncbi:MAG: hypothetical protein ACQESR_28845, partial [Planctomycetota bacterium]